MNDNVPDTIDLIISQTHEYALYGDEGEYSVSDELDELTDEERFAVYEAAQLFKQAAGLVASVALQGMGVEQGEHLRLGDNFITRSPKKTWVPRDMKALIEYLLAPYTDDPEATKAVQAALTPGVRVTGLDAVATLREVDPWTLRDTFLTRKGPDTPVVQVIPAARAAKKYQDMEHGDRR